MNVYRPNRVIFDETGEVVAMTGEGMGTGIPPLKEIQSLDFIDIPHGSIDYNKYHLKGVDIETKQPILELIPVAETEEQKRIRELEDALLLAANLEMGGIL